MRSGVSLSERCFTLVLWLVAVAFAGFLIGLGSLVVGDLPQVEHRYTLEQFLDTGKSQATAAALKQLRRERSDNQQQTDQAQLALDAARSASAAARETFANWLKTRDTTQRVDQDPGLIARTAATRRAEGGRAGGRGAAGRAWPERISTSRRNNRR